MPTTTSRLGLLQPVVSDGPNELRLADTSNTNILDSAALFFSGTLANRASAVTTLVAGAVYRATDTGLYYIYNGSAWGTLPGFGQDLLVPLTQGTSTTVAAGNRYLAAAGTTMTLPAPSDGLAVGITAATTATATSPVTVSYGSGGGSIFGGGLVAGGAASFALGTPVASVTLHAQSSNWIIHTGVQDTGWALMAGGAGVGPGAGFAPASRLLGDRIHLCGSLSFSGLVSPGNTWAQLAHLPLTTAVLTGLYQPSTTFIAGAVVGTDGVMRSTYGVNSGSTIGLDGWSFRHS